MQLRKSTREKPNKKTVVSSDESEPEEVLTKKTKLTSKGSYIANEAILTEELGFGKRVRRKNATFKNYKLYDDSDSDYDAGPRVSRKSGAPRKKRGSKPRDATQIEFLLDWKREINISSVPTAQNSSKVVNSKKILDADLKQHGSDLQALFININWWTKHNPTGIKIDDFRRLDLNKKLMKNGIVFVWSEKEILGRLIKIMEEKGFFYIENFVIALLDPTKADVNPKEKEETKPKVIANKNSSPVKGRGRKVISPEDSESSTTSESTKNGKVFKEDGNENDFFLHNLEKYPVLQANQLLYEGNSEYLKISKRVLMMFRRVADKKENNLELRHQRTCDALFDLVNPSVSYGASDLRSKEYVYKLIETLLPKANYNPEEKSLKMMELWADQTRAREGWISVCEKL